MKRRYGIGFLIGIIAVIIFFVFVFQFSYSRALEKNNETKAQQENVDEGYCIKEEDGYVIVYMGGQETVFEYTSIWVEDLPADIQLAVKNGIYLENLSEVYGFLENYSS